MSEQYEPEVVTRTAVPTAAVRGRERMDQLAAFYDRVYPTVGQVLGAQGIAPREAFGRYGAVVDGVVDIEVGFTLDGPVSVDGEVAAGELPAGEYAHLTHVGRYELLSESWARLGAWIPEQGRSAGQTVFEVYTDDPTEADPDSLRTDLYWSLF